MAEKVTYASKAQLVLEPREKYHRQSNIGTAWNEVRLGMLYTFNDNVTVDSVTLAETVTFASYLDWFCLGLMNDVTTIPGQTGTKFAGMAYTSKTGATGVTMPSNAAGSASIAWNGAGNHAPTSAIIDAAISTLSTGSGRAIIPIYNASSYAAFIGLKFVVSNPGASNQEITVSSVYTAGPEAITPITALAVLRGLITGGSYIEVAALPWNDGAAAYDLPDCWFVRSPFLTNRLRISAMELILVS